MARAADHRPGLGPWWRSRRAVQNASSSYAPVGAAIRRLRCAIGEARLARSDVEQVFGTGVACRRLDLVRCVLAVACWP
jgi:hypothetical protein